MEYSEFRTIIGNLIRNKCTQDGFIKIKDEPKLLLKELKVVQHIEDLGDETINLLSNSNYKGFSWEMFTAEIQRIIHEQLKRSGYVYETQEKEVEKNEQAILFIRDLANSNPQILYKHLKNELILFYFKVRYNLNSIKI